MGCVGRFNSRQYQPFANELTVNRCARRFEWAVQAASSGVPYDRIVLTFISATGGCDRDGSIDE
jgi:hypothetical protein